MAYKAFLGSVLILFIESLEFALSATVLVFSIDDFLFSVAFSVFKSSSAFNGFSHAVHNFASFAFLAPQLKHVTLSSVEFTDVTLSVILSITSIAAISSSFLNLYFLIYSQYLLLHCL